MFYQDMQNILLLDKSIEYQIPAKLIMLYQDKQHFVRVLNISILQHLTSHRYVTTTFLTSPQSSEFQQLLLSSYWHQQSHMYEQHSRMDLTGQKWYIE